MNGACQLHQCVHQVSIWSPMTYFPIFFPQPITSINFHENLFYKGFQVRGYPQPWCSIFIHLFLSQTPIFTKWDITLFQNQMISIEKPNLLVFGIKIVYDIEYLSANKLIVCININDNIILLAILSNCFNFVSKNIITFIPLNYLRFLH